MRNTTCSSERNYLNKGNAKDFKNSTNDEEVSTSISEYNTVAVY